MSAWLRRRPAAALIAIVAIVALAGACRTPAPTPAPPAPPAPATTPAPSATAAGGPPVEPDVCHASVDWRNGGFEIYGLPCITRDGGEVLLAKLGEPSGPPELTVLAITRDDRLARHAIVMEAYERGELLDAAGGPTPELRQRIVKANVLVADASRRAVPLAPLPATPAGTHAGGGIEVAWTEQGRLTISRGGHFVHEGDHGAWLEPRAACGAPYLAQVWGDAARGVLLIKLAYRGGASCAAGPALHVVSWAPRAGAP